MATRDFAVFDSDNHAALGTRPGIAAMRPGSRRSPDDPAASRGVIAAAAGRAG